MSLDNIVMPTVIDAETEGKVTINERQLVVPPELQIVGVENDNNVENIYFEVPRYFDGVNDLDTFDIRVNWINALKEVDSSPVEKISSTESIITVKWQVPRGLCVKEGDVEISIQAVHSDGRTWNTTTVQLQVLKGVLLSDSISKQYPDIINELLIRVQNLESSKPSDGNVDLKDYAKTVDVDRKLASKLNKNQGVEHNGKILGIDGQGNIVPVEKPTVVEGTGVTKEQAQALDGLFSKAVFKEDVTNQYRAFKTAFGLGDTPEPPKPPVPPVDEWTISNNLTNVSTDNPIQSIKKGSSYMAKLTATDGFELETVTVIMGTDVTSTAYQNGTITIEAVTDNVVITANAVKPATQQVQYLDYVGNKGTAWIDTEYAPNNPNDKILIGLGYYTNEEYPTEKPHPWVLGVTFPWGSPYKNWLIQTENPAEANAKYRIKLNLQGIEVTLNTGQDQYDSGKPNLTFTDSAKYIYISNGKQALYSDEAMSKQPAGGTFAKLETSSSFNVTPENMPVTPIYIGAVNDGYEGTVTLYPQKIYCFKIWRAGQLIIDMKPAKKGQKVGMFDKVRNKFFENKGTGNFEYGKVID